jgi:uncharacterized protein YndB with AHSA1/START domain
MGARAVVEQHVPADAAAVYAAWTDADRLARWWWPHLPDTRYVLDAREGGGYLIETDAAGIGIRGEFVELDPPRLIRFTWTWLNRGVPVVEEPVSVTFQPQRDGTLVTVTHELADLPDHAENIRIGWEDVLGRLGRLFRGDSPREESDP